MKDSFLQFVVHGNLGDLALGIGRGEIIDRMGLPVSWSGQFPSFGETVSIPQNAKAWFYFGDAAGIKFNDLGVSTAVFVNPSLIDSTKAPFLDWPVGKRWRAKDFCFWLGEKGIPFREGDWNGSHSIHAASHCVAICSSYDKGELLARGDREIFLIESASTGDMEDVDKPF